MRKIELDRFEQLKAALGAQAAEERVCDAPGCAAPGEHRAPKSPSELNSYYWFCLEHVREYNKAWNYYAGLNEDEIEAQIQFDTRWQRPTWPLGARVGGSGRFKHHEQVFRDAFGFFEDGGEARHRRNGHERHAPRYGTERERALAVLELACDADATTVKARYKELVKRYHPDANGGDRDAEERLKAINHAYATLKKEAVF